MGLRVNDAGVVSVASEVVGVLMGLVPVVELADGRPTITGNVESLDCVHCGLLGGVDRLMCPVSGIGGVMCSR